MHAFVRTTGNEKETGPGWSEGIYAAVGISSVVQDENSRISYPQQWETHRFYVVYAGPADSAYSLKVHIIPGTLFQNCKTYPALILTILSPKTGGPILKGLGTHGCIENMKIAKIATATRNRLRWLIFLFCPCFAFVSGRAGGRATTDRRVCSRPLYNRHHMLQS